jgi:hypothetical protein
MKEVKSEEDLSKHKELKQTIVTKEVKSEKTI